MDDALLKKERPSVMRIREAVGVGDVSHFVVTCPKDVTMYEDAVKAVPEAGAMRIRDLAELVEEACRIDGSIVAGATARTATA